MFQSRLGFSGRLDVSPVLRLVQCLQFQSRLGFSGRLDTELPVIHAEREKFQSRLGFSGRLDATSCTKTRNRSSVSIPSWVFWSSRPVVSWIPKRLLSQFQSRLGFSGRLDARRIIEPQCHELFQSRLGFSGRLDYMIQLVNGLFKPQFQSRLGFSGRLDYTFICFMSYHK